MANNFRFTGVTSPSYISKDGNDANSGLTADLPKATLARYATNNIIGCGQYKGAFSLSNLSVSSYYTDGLAKILCTANFVTSGGGSTTSFNTPTTGGILIIDLQGFTFTANTTNLGKVVVLNGIIGGSGVTGIGFATGSIFESCTGTLTVTPAVSIGGRYDKSMFFNCGLSIGINSVNFSYFKNCYTDEATTISNPTYFAVVSKFSNNNFQGKFNIGGILYELKRERDGTAIDPNPAVLDLITIDATVYDRGNFSQDAEFNNIEKRDYWSVANTSPMLFGADDSLNIGDVKSAVTFTTADTEINGGITDLILSSGDYIVNLPATTGQNANLVMQIAPIAQTIESVDLAVLLNFDSLQTKGTAENTMITIVDNYTTGTAGANPRRLTYKMRWSSQDAEPTTSGEYDNNGFVTAGDFSKFEQFTQPLIDVASLGNGEPTFNPAGASPIKAKWIQVIEVMNDGIG